MIYKDVDIQMVKWSDFSGLIDNPWTQCKIETQLKAVHRCSQPAFVLLYEKMYYNVKAASNKLATTSHSPFSLSCCNLSRVVIVEIEEIIKIIKHKVCQSAEFASALTLLNITGRSGWVMTEDLFDL